MTIRPTRAGKRKVKEKGTPSPRPWQVSLVSKATEQSRKTVTVVGAEVAAAVGAVEIVVLTGIGEAIRVMHVLPRVRLPARRGLPRDTRRFSYRENRSRSTSGIPRLRQQLKSR